MSLPQTPGPYGLGPTDGEALWFNGSLSVLKATTQSTDGRFAAMEILGPKGFGAPLHIHKKEDEFFLIMSGDVRSATETTSSRQPLVRSSMARVKFRTHSRWIARKRGCSFSSPPVASKASSERAASPRVRWRSLLRTRSSSTGRRSKRSPGNTGRNSSDRLFLQRTDQARGYTAVRTRVAFVLRGPVTGSPMFRWRITARRLLTWARPAFPERSEARRGSRQGALCRSPPRTCASRGSNRRGGQSWRRRAARDARSCDPA